MRAVTSPSPIPFIVEVCLNFSSVYPLFISFIAESRKEKIVSWLDGPDPSMTHNQWNWTVVFEFGKVQEMVGDSWK
jgi:hypothetical protein